MQDKIRIDLETGLFIETVHPDEIGEDIVETPCTVSFYIPKCTGESWEEGATQEYIDRLKAQAEPSLEERIQALEAMELERILGGGF